MTRFISHQLQLILALSLSRVDFSQGVSREQPVNLPFDKLSVQLQLILVEADDCRLVAINPGSVAVNPG